MSYRCMGTNKVLSCLQRCRQLEDYRGRCQHKVSNVAGGVLGVTGGGEDWLGSRSKIPQINCYAAAP